jgi:hypothetical protein
MPLFVHCLGASSGDPAVSGAMGEQGGLAGVDQSAGEGPGGGVFSHLCRIISAASLKVKAWRQFFGTKRADSWEPQP